MKRKLAGYIINNCAGGHVLSGISDDEESPFYVRLRPYQRRDDGVMERGSQVVVVPHRLHQGLFVVNDDQLSTKNMIPGEAVYGETLVPVQNEDGTEVEYRVWNPSGSDLADLILEGVNNIWIKPNAKVLYLGADSFTTVSHLSDIVGTSGMVYAVTSSPCTNLSDLAIKRTNITPIHEDPSHPSNYRNLVGNVDVMLSEIPLFCQVQVMALNASYFLKVGCHFVVSFQAKRLKLGMPIASGAVIGLQYSKLRREKFEPYQEVNIEGHIAYYVGTYNGRAEVDSHTFGKRN